MCDRPSDVSYDDAVTNFEMYRKARARFEGRDNVVPFRPRQMAEQQVHNDTCMEIARLTRLSTEAAGKYDDEGDGK